MIENIIGGLAGLFFGAGLAKRILKFEFQVTDTITVAIPISMAIQKVGCLTVSLYFRISMV
jgi:hypothetical protein